MERISLVPTPEQIAKPRLAATVILVRDGVQGPEAFLMRRSMQSAFMPGAYVFPGGKVDPTDALLVPDAKSPAFVVAAVREVFEEVGVLLALDAQGNYPKLSAQKAYWRAQQERVQAQPEYFATLLKANDLTIATELIKHWTWWMTPVVETRRFDTRFFIARLPEGQEPLHDGYEATDSLWMPVGQCVLSYQDGELTMAPPTMATLVEMSGLETVDALMSAAPYDAAMRFPFFGEDSQNRAVLLLPGDPEYPKDQPPVRGPTRVVLERGRWWVVQ